MWWGRPPSLDLSFSLSETQTKKKKCWNVYILHSDLPYFDLFNSLHTRQLACKLATKQAIHAWQWRTRCAARNKNISIKSMPMISHFTHTLIWFCWLPTTFSVQLWKKYGGEGQGWGQVNERLKWATRGQRELRHISAVLIRNVTKWWILRSCALQQEMNSDLRAMDHGAPTTSWEIIWLRRWMTHVTSIRPQLGAKSIYNYLKWPESIRVYVDLMYVCTAQGHSSIQSETGDPWCLFSAWDNNNSQCNTVQPGQHRTGRLSRIMACFLSARWTLPLWQNTDSKGTHVGGKKAHFFLLLTFCFYHSTTAKTPHWPNEATSGASTTRSVFLSRSFVFFSESIPHCSNRETITRTSLAKWWPCDRPAALRSITQGSICTLSNAYSSAEATQVLSPKAKRLKPGQGQVRQGRRHTGVHDN